MRALGWVRIYSSSRIKLLKGELWRNWNDRAGEINANTEQLQSPFSGASCEEFHNLAILHMDRATNFWFVIAKGFRIFESSNLVFQCYVVSKVVLLDYTVGSCSNQPWGLKRSNRYTWIVPLQNGFDMRTCPYFFTFFIAIGLYQVPIYVCFHC